MIRMLKGTAIILMATAFLVAPALGADTAQKLCPVMGNPIDKNIYLDYKGQRIYFCCKACPEEFKKNPEKYLKILKDQGVVPEKAPAAPKK